MRQLHAEFHVYLLSVALLNAQCLIPPRNYCRKFCCIAIYLLFILKKTAIKFAYLFDACVCALQCEDCTKRRLVAAPTSQVYIVFMLK